MTKTTAALIETANAYSAARAAFEKANREAVASAPEVDDAVFWKAVDTMAARWRSYGMDSARIEQAADNALWDIMSEGDWTMDAWAVAAGVARRYRKVSSELHKALWELPGVEKGDDSYGDWTDALPLVGQAILHRIASGELRDYRAICEAVAEAHGEAFSKRIEHGELYAATALESKAGKFLTCAARRASDSDDDE